VSGKTCAKDFPLTGNPIVQVRGFIPGNMGNWLMTDPTPSFYYVVKDLTENVKLGEFTLLSGGEMTVATLPYVVVTTEGEVRTINMPGQTSYGQVKLTRAMDKDAEAIYLEIEKAISGKWKKARKNFSVEMIDPADKSKAIVTWNLINSVVIALSGFAFNQNDTDTYTQFEMTIQAERIDLVFS
jgi:phage tail-like protein